jgi:hypothetical protein
MDKFSYEEIVSMPIGKIGQDVLKGNKIDEDAIGILEQRIAKAIQGADTAHIIMALLHVVANVIYRTTGKVKKDK